MAASDTDKPGTGDVVHSDVELRETVPASVPIVDDDEEDRVTPKAMFCIFVRQQCPCHPSLTNDVR